MRSTRHRAIELTFGSALLLGPLIYALSLPSLGMEVEPAVVEVAVPVAVPVQAEPELEPEPEPELEPELVLVEVGYCEGEGVEDELTEVPEAPAEQDATWAMRFVDSGTLVLSEAADRSWTKGRLRALEGDYRFVAAKSVDSAAIPADLLAARERTFDLYGSEGKLCHARLGELRVVAQYGGDTIVDLEEEDEDGEYVLPDSAELHGWVWDTQEHWLVGELLPEPGCEIGAALWARDAALPAPTLLRASTSDNPLVVERREAFSRSQAMAEIEAGYREWYASLDEETREWELDWETTLRESPVEALSWLDARGAPKLTELNFGWTEDCGFGFDSQLSALEGVGEDRAGVEGYATVGARAVFDADLDGKYEFFYVDPEDDEVRVASETLSASFRIEQDWHCPC
ncbi:hypothetical protein G6O69_33000 [Pseudenhygromyxa sp. WMMC2535]|uniref:hypothetical protein n=1 Tax=Pseudenhygromyxa sp. WMMC2535 TaxID=2712867 RepID=UPI00155546CE|nr:hypothetical protein [Pseudenhygromyxa sp. WMMC2535]NVB42687.1 hypothetical protein [Pseudenhygromyxa sp. WMMC2535]